MTRKALKKRLHFLWFCLVPAEFALTTSSSSSRFKQHSVEQQKTMMMKMGMKMVLRARRGGADRPAAH